MPFELPRRSDLAALAATGLYLWLSIVLRGCRPASGRGEDEHSLQIPGHRHQNSIRRELSPARAVKIAGIRATT